MAKLIGPKTMLIRDAIKAHPELGNTELAELINRSPVRKEDKIEVTANDIAKQKQALKNLPASEPAAPAPELSTAKKRGRPAGARQPARAHHPPAGPTNGVPSPAALIDEVLALAKHAGGLGELKQLVEKIAELQKR